MDRPHRREVWTTAASVVRLSAGAIARLTLRHTLGAVRVGDVQVLNGFSGAMFGVMMTVVANDLTRGTGRFNLAQGIVGCAVGIGASLSTTLAGYATDHFGSTAAFLTLAGLGAAGLALVAALMPETRPPDE